MLFHFNPRYYAAGGSKLFMSDRRLGEGGWGTNVEKAVAAEEEAASAFPVRGQPLTLMIQVPPRLSCAGAAVFGSTVCVLCVWRWLMIVASRRVLRECQQPLSRHVPAPHRHRELRGPAAAQAAAYRRQAEAGESRVP